MFCRSSPTECIEEHLVAVGCAREREQKSAYRARNQGELSFLRQFLRSFVPEMVIWDRP